MEGALPSAGTFQRGREDADRMERRLPSASGACVSGGRPQCSVLCRDGTEIWKYVLNTVSNTSTGHIQFTLKYFRDLQRSQMSSFCHSLVCALAAGLLSSFVGILLAYYTRRRKSKGMAAAEFAASLPYIIPGTFSALAMWQHSAIRRFCCGEPCGSFC